MKTRITKLAADIELPVYKTAGSVAFDLATNETKTIPAHGTVFVRTGLIIATPPGHAFLVTGRSSLFKNKGLRLGNQMGVIDQDYCGPEDELLLFLWNPTDKDVTVEKGERLAQGLFVQISKAEWEEGPAQSNASRGGWGSTGSH